MAVVDYNYCFKYIDVGCNGRISDGGVFQNCSISNALENGLLPNGTFLVGDDAFPLKSYLLKPFSGRNLSYGQKIFNYRLSRGRRVVENAFGILASKFRLFEKPLPYSPDKVVKIVRACCALHNWLRCREGSNYLQYGCIDIEDTQDGTVIEGRWRNIPITGMLNLTTNLGNRSSESARQMREKLVEYFLGAGAVPWQTRMVY